MVVISRASSIKYFLPARTAKPPSKDCVQIAIQVFLSSAVRLLASLDFRKRKRNHGAPPALAHLFGPASHRIPPRVCHAGQRKEAEMDEPKCCGCCAPVRLGLTIYVSIFLALSVLGLYHYAPLPNATFGATFVMDKIMDDAKKFCASEDACDAVCDGNMEDLASPLRAGYAMAFILQLTNIGMFSLGVGAWPAQGLPPQTSLSQFAPLPVCSRRMQTRCQTAQGLHCRPPYGHVLVPHPAHRPEHG